jgi:hypothetical protein
MKPRKPWTAGRKRVLWSATLHDNDRSLDCAACDISAGGAKIRISERLTVNSKVLLTIHRIGSFLGEIRWQREDHAAIRFLEEASTIEELLRRAAPASSEVPRTRTVAGEP